MDRKNTFDSGRRAIAAARPRLLGSADELKKLARERPAEYRRMMEQVGEVVVRPALTRPAATQAAGTQPAGTRPAGRRRRSDAGNFYDVNARCIGLAIGYVVEGDATRGRAAVDRVLRDYIDRPIEAGHVTFAHSMARCAIVYDLCHELWTAEERGRFSKYVHETIAANVDSEPSVFHNGWYGYKHWGYGMAAYALMHDDPGARKILDDLERDYLELAAPALTMAGAGGGWAEGFYVHYWILEWLFFCETARRVEGVDYYAAAPEFYGKRAVAAMFECYPPIEPRGSHQPIPMGDGHGRVVNNERDKELAARRILCAYYREDPDHQAVHAFNLQTPKVVFGANAYMDFLWNDGTIKAGDLEKFRLSQVSKGAGFVYARSSWKEDATHFFFKCGPRYTAHQHLDNGHFEIYRGADLLGDGGHYDSFDTTHALNYYIRTVAHNSVLVYDPAEKWPEKAPATPKGIRDIAGHTANDGGQYYPWSAAPMRGGANGVAMNVADWMKVRDIMEIGTLAAAKDHGGYLYCAGDYTKSYAPSKVKSVTRQIVYVRPGTFIVFDRVEATDAGFRKSVVFQLAKVPERVGEHWVVTNGSGRLFLQTLALAQRDIDLFHGDSLYNYHGGTYPPKYLDPPAPECRMEISPLKPAKFHHFLNVLTATAASVKTVPPASAKVDGKDLVVTVGALTIRFALEAG